MSGTRAPAFVLLGGLRVILRNWLYLTELRRRGLRPLVITSEEWREATQRAMASGEHPGALIADAGFVGGEVEIEGSFTAGVIAQLMAWRERHDIVGVFAAGEMMVEQAGIIADLLGLPSPGLRASRVCRSKYLQRAYLPEWSPRVTVIPPGSRASPDLDGVSFPAVLKPSGRRSSSGVLAVTSREQLLARAAEYLPGETLLVEEYVSGPEFSAETLLQDGRVIFESLTRKRTNEGATRRFVELGHTVPAPESPGNAALLAANRAILSALDFGSGIAHSELRLAADGRPVLMEIAARTPGDGLLPLYHLAAGRPMEPGILGIALGESVTYPALRRHSRQVYLEAGPGILDDVRVSYPGCREVAWAAEGEAWPELRPGQPGDPPALRAVLVLKKRGSAIGELRQSDDRVVTFLIDADSPAELDELEAGVRASVEVRMLA